MLPNTVFQRRNVEAYITGSDITQLNILIHVITTGNFMSRARLQHGTTGLGNQAENAVSPRAVVTCFTQATS